MGKLSEKLKAVAAAVAAIEKQFGKGAIMQLGRDGEVAPVAVIPSGSVGLDRALGVGGYPRGRVIEVFGNESSGKTPSPCTPSPRSRRREASRPSSTPSTPST